MRKFLMVVAVGALALLVAAPANALDFKYGQETRVRFYDFANLGFNSVGGANTNPRGVQLRIRPRFDASDDNGNITSTWRAEYGDTEFGGGGGANGNPLGIDRFGNNVSYSSVASGNRVGNGAGGGAGADGVALETKWAYLDFQMPFGVPLRVRAGLQPWYLTKGLITDDDYAGVRAYGQIKPVSYEAWWFRANRGGTTNVVGRNGGNPNFNTAKDNAFDLYGGKIDVAVAKVFNPYLYYVYGDNRSVCDGGTAGNFFNPPAACAANAKRVHPQHYVGLGFIGDVGFMSYDLDFIWGYAKGGPNGALINAAGETVNVQGWVVDGGVHVPIGPVRFNFVGSFATGDNRKKDNKSTAFPGGPGPSWSGPSQVAGGAYELIGEGGRFDVFTSTQQANTNLWTIGFSVEYNPVKALNLRLHYLFAGFAKKNGNCARAVTGSIECFGNFYQGKGYDPATGSGGIADKSTLGQELGLLAEYQMWTGFKVQGFTGWLFPSSGTTEGKYILQLLYNF